MSTRAILTFKGINGHKMSLSEVIVSLFFKKDVGKLFEYLNAHTYACLLCAYDCTSGRPRHETHFKFHHLVAVIVEWAIQQKDRGRGQPLNSHWLHPPNVTLQCSHHLSLSPSSQRRSTCRHWWLCGWRRHGMKLKQQLFRLGCQT